MGDKDGKTEEPTAKRRSDERKKGNVFQSKEIGTLLSLVAVIYTIQFLGDTIMNALLGLFNRFWGLAGVTYTLNNSDVLNIYIESMIAYASAAIIPLLVAGLVAIIVTLAQTRGLFSTEKLKPKFAEMFNPANLIKKFFNPRALFELLKSILKIILLAYIIYGVYVERIELLPRLMETDFAAVLPFAVDFFMDILLSVIPIFAVLAAVDYLFQRRQYEKDLRMSKQEIKEEYKQTEGDPQIKGQIRAKQRQMSQGRMMAQVPDADVIVRNPTHYAVALKYDNDAGQAPKVLAKGADLLALRIVRTGEENGVMCIENKPLARSLYDNVPLDSEIPMEFYGAVAEVLAYVYSLQGKHVVDSDGKRHGGG